VDGLLVLFINRIGIAVRDEQERHAETHRRDRPTLEPIHDTPLKDGEGFTLRNSTGTSTKQIVFSHSFSWVSLPTSPVFGIIMGRRRRINMSQLVGDSHVP